MYVGAAESGVGVREIEQLRADAALLDEALARLRERAVTKTRVLEFADAYCTAVSIVGVARDALTFAAAQIESGLHMERGEDGLHYIVWPGGPG